MSAYVIPAFILICVVTGLSTRTPVYEAFVRGAKQGFATAVRIMPYIVAFSFAVSFFGAAGGFTLIARLLAPVLTALRLPAETLPLILTRPFSGGAAMGALSQVFAECGPDSYAGLLASVMMGSSETIFYTIALYFGAVGVKKTRYTLPAALLSMLAGAAASVWLSSLYYK